MLTYAELEATAAEIAAPLRARLEATGFCLLATLRRDGSPRISPIDVSFSDGGLYVGSMPGAVKARDLQRDPRCALIAPVVDNDGKAGEGKAFLHAIEITDRERAVALVARSLEDTDLDLDDFVESHMFELRVTGAAWQTLEGETWMTTSWREGEDVRHRRRDGPGGEVVDG